ncbi:hypothetical protein [Delftia phage PhiW-14]|uniref:Uncharacterized protein n=1 Tax=Delftia phage PhiW-14 TaxID=665032 RepID=C9DG81_BPW14|nr:hypothetical protein DP-phiW-14_gp111 [Delftia phage PhiW-14]ACV50132.1 hypothetical protein [Delftia phage PhiW-14]
MKSIYALIAIAFAGVLYQAESQAQAQGSVRPSMYMDDTRAGLVDPARQAKVYRFDQWYNLNGEMVVCADNKKSLCVEVADSIPKGYTYLGFQIKDQGMLVVYMTKKVNR